MPSATAIRFNQLATIDHFDSKDGVMTVTAIARTPGILTYRNADGSTRRELVSREFLRRTDSNGVPLVAQLANLPVTNEHPPCLLRNDADLLKKYQVGRTQNKVHVFDDGRVQVTFDVFDPETQDDIRLGRKDGVSVGYETAVKHDAGEWHGQHFDAMQDEPIDKDHMAVCVNNRAIGAKIKAFKFDSADTTDIAWQVDSVEPEQPLTATRKDAPMPQMFQIELATPDGKAPFMVPRELYMEIKRLGLDDCGCHVDAAEMELVFDADDAEYRVDSDDTLWRFDKATGKGKQCPGGYYIPQNRNCNPKTHAKREGQKLNKLAQKKSTFDPDYEKVAGKAIDKSMMAAKGSLAARVSENVLSSAYSRVSSPYTEGLRKEEADHLAAKTLARRMRRGKSQNTTGEIAEEAKSREQIRSHFKNEGMEQSLASDKSRKKLAQKKRIAEKRRLQSQGLPNEGGAFRAKAASGKGKRASTYRMPA
ncbi:MAG: DUF2213 domain-containing protein [Stenomitos rutilans HA7619-LM2]|jgi:hypothetical protein|nr:DUF2213 domain-containing protein [Stenomitos rutilans HA7619-LM2]MBW4469452.1 DUF2213 domain-containing protein [Stenomitos rutilans HA7619-LM2]